MTETQDFRPFETRLDRDRTQRQLADTLAGGDDGELFLEHVRSESLVFDDRRLKSAAFNVSEGFGLRAVRDEAVGYAHSTEISEAAITRASDIVRLAVGDGGRVMAPDPAATNRRVSSDGDPTTDAEFATKIRTLAEIDAFARAQDRRVVQVTVRLGASFQHVEILRPGGGFFRDLRPLALLSVSVIVERNGRRETGQAGTGGRYGLVHLLAPERWQAQVREALRIALVNLDAEPAPAGVMPVALGPGWPGVLLHEAVGHGLEGDFNRKETSVFSGLMGQRVAAPGVTVIDDGTIVDRRGSIAIDDEGTPTERTVLIEDGILVGYMQDRQNARLMDTRPTGNGRRQGFAHTPMPRMTNTIMLAGPGDPADVVADMSDGIHAVGFGGGQVDITNGKFVFSCTEAYRVKNGRREAPIRGATLIGDGATALKGIRAVGNDMELDPGIGNCGKNGQWVPVGVGQPTLLIDGLTVGGSAL
ncbi:MAG: metallopeptidase TldD-related protein [Paracoccaceae bacterium]|nr:metallopeptidase TldD-related protein [Paracoccaceae bacterium]